MLMSAQNRRILLVLAVSAWLTQLLLPLSQMAWMSRSPTRIAAWCGIGSLALEIQLRQLPASISEVLQLAMPKSAYGQDCGACCHANVTSALIPPAAPHIMLQASDLGQVSEPPAPASGRRLSVPPPARGPPGLC